MEPLNDHDLLIELRTEMRGMREDIKDLKDGTATELAAQRKDIEELKQFKTAVKTWGTAGMFILGVLEVALNYFWK